MPLKTKETSYTNPSGWYRGTVYDNFDAGLFGEGPYGFTANLKGRVFSVPRSYVMHTTQQTTTVQRITYETGPRIKSGYPNNKRCVHSIHGFDPRSILKDGGLGFRVKGHYPNESRESLRHYQVNTDEGTRDLTWDIQGEVDIYDHVMSSQEFIWTPDLDFHDYSLNLPDISSVEKSNTTALLLRFFSPDQYSEWVDYTSQAFANFRQQTDLNKRLEGDSLFYSDLIQTALPMTGLLKAKQGIQRTAAWLSSHLARYKNKPFLTALQDIAKTDMFNRFVVQTTLRSCRDYSDSFRSVVELFETGAASNAAQYQRLSWHPKPYIASLASTKTSKESIGLGAWPSRWQASETQGEHSLKYYQTEYQGELYNLFTEESRVTPSILNGAWNFSVGPAYALRKAFYEGFGGSLSPQVTVRYSAGITSQVQFWTWARVRYKNLGSLSPLKVWMNRVGITKPLNSAWDLIPFSFVVDYFLRLGDLVEGYSNFFADFKELRGDIIDVTTPWMSEKWELGTHVSFDEYDSQAAVRGLQETGFTGSVAHSHVSLANASRYARYPVASMEECFRDSWSINKNQLSSTQERTLVELALNLKNPLKHSNGPLDENRRAALRMLRRNSRQWRKNGVISQWSTDQFRDYLTRTLKQVSNTSKVLRTRTR